MKGKKNVAFMRTSGVMDNSGELINVREAVAKEFKFLGPLTAILEK